MEPADIKQKKTFGRHTGRPVGSKDSSRRTRNVPLPKDELLKLVGKLKFLIIIKNY